MPRWLVKQEPDEFPFAELERVGETPWEGVKNPLAVKHLRAMAVGDEVLFYHTGKEKAVVGIARVVRAADADHPPILAAVRRLSRPVTLAAVKADDRFAGWELVRQPRLSVLPVSDAVWAGVCGLAGEAHP